MSDIAHLAATIFRHAARSRRFIVAIAGPPGAGKSTISEELISLLPQGSAAIVPMDGFHYDNAVLDRMGLRHRKGAPETFDFAGFSSLLARLRAADTDVAIPIFDRSMELSRASAAIVARETKFLLVEGNYLLLDEEPWSTLAPMINFSIFLNVRRAELERRLLQRWHDHGRSDEDARHWIASNDMPNIDRVLSRRRVADLLL